MSRNFKTSKSNRTQYIYYSADGTKVTLSPAENEITETDIALLHEFDDAEMNNNRKNEKGQIRVDALRSKDDGEDFSDRFEEFADHKVDILGAMITREENAQIYEAVAKLSLRQQALIEALLSGKSMAEFARENGISHEAARIYRERASKALKKYLKNF